MRIGYLMNMYPVISGTFIRREIHAIEAEGVEVMRYALPKTWELRGLVLEGRPMPSSPTTGDSHHQTLG